MSWLLFFAKSAVRPGTLNLHFFKYIVSCVKEWQPMHSERINVTQAVGQFDHTSAGSDYQLPRDIDSFSFQKFAGIYCKV